MTSDTQPSSGPASAPEAMKYLGRVRLGLLLSAALFFAPLLVVLVMAGFEWLAAIWFPLIFCIPHMVTLPRLFGKVDAKTKKGLRGAGNICTAGIILWGIVAGVPFTTGLLSWLNDPDQISGPTVSNTLAVCLAGVTGVAVHWFARRSVRAASEVLWPGSASPERLLGGIAVAAYYFLLLAWAAMVIPGSIRGRPMANETSAVGSLRTIHTAAEHYRAQFENGYPPSLGALARPPDIPLSQIYQATCAAADLLDSLLAAGKKTGYMFTYTPGPSVTEPAPGCPPGAESYSVTARPREFGETGGRNFLIDETGIIYMTQENRPATRSDPRVE